MYYRIKVTALIFFFSSSFTPLQVDSLSVSPAPDGRPELMVSQPGCGYAILLCSWTQDGAAAPGETRTAASAG